MAALATEPKTEIRVMNRFIDILNRIRQNINPDWLTPTQQAAYNLLRERLAFLDEVNLWGGHGVGKTFLGWVLQSQGLAAYKPRSEEIGLASLLDTVIVDNIGWQRAIVRDLLHLCRNQGYQKVVFITTEPAREQMATIELLLTDEDLVKASANLRSIGIAPYSGMPHSLWDLVSPMGL